MHKATQVILDEHRSMSAVLSGMKELARMAQAARKRPDFEVLRAMVYYVDAFPERMHHPKENDLLFGALELRCAKARPLLAGLRAEHVVGAKMIRDLERALLAYDQSWPAGGDRFAAEVDRYAQFHWDHMRREEREVLPLADAFLTAEDWTELDAGFANNQDPIADLREQDFRDLFQKIVRLAPAPVGLGEAWRG